MMYKCPILSDNCVAIHPRKWTCNAGLTPTWYPLMTHLCDTCANAGDCPAEGVDVIYENVSIVDCVYYKEDGADE